MCVEISDISISRCRLGAISNFNVPEINIQRIIFAENNVGTNIWMASASDDNNIRFNKIIFLALARPNCNYCYAIAGSCSYQKAIAIPIVQDSGNSLSISSDTSEGLLIQNTDAALDSKLILKDVQFINYKLNYISDINKNFRLCKNNLIFEQPIVADQSTRIYLHHTTTNNSEFSSFIKLKNPPEQYLYWRGGCGNLNCSGNKNWILTDSDGFFFTQPSQIIPLNDGIKFPSCVLVNEWNGYLCRGIHFGMLEFQNDGLDQRYRLIAPVEIVSENIDNILNQWREWKWLGPDPRDKRLARFNGIVERNKTMNMKFQVTIPEELKFKLENYGDFWWVVVSIKYERPDVIEVWNMVNKTFINSNRLDQNINLTKLAAYPESCGANIYDPENSSIHFILNNAPKCILKVRTVSAVRITLHFETSLAEFYNNNGEATALDKISTFLGISMNRLRISKVRIGSVYLGIDIVESKEISPSTSSLDTANTDYNAKSQDKIDKFNQMIEELSNHRSKLEKGANDGSLTFDKMKLLDAKTEMIYTNISMETNSTSSTTDNGGNNNPSGSNIIGENWNNWNNNITNRNSNKNYNIEEVKQEENTMLYILVGIIISTLLFTLLCFVIKNKEGISLIKLAFEYSFSNGGVSYNRLIPQKKVK